MEQNKENQLMQDLALVLIYLSSWEEKNIADQIIHRCWKGYDFNILDQLKEKGLIEFSYTAKSLYISEEGLQKAQMLLAKFEKV